MSRAGAVPLLAVVATGLVAAVAVVTLDWRLVVPVAIGLPLVTLATLDAWLTPGPPPPARGAPLFAGRLHDEGWLAWLWALMAVFTTVGLFAGDRDVTEAASGNLSVDNLLELVVVGTAGLTVLSAVRRGWSARVPRHTWLFLGFSALALASVLWSQLVLFSAGRAVEFVVIATFAAYNATRARAEEGFAERLLVRTLRYLGLLVVVLAVWAVAVGGLDYPRFSFRGTHANAAAALMAIVVLALVLHPQRVRIARPLPWWLVAIGLLPLIYETGARANTVAAVLALVAGLVVAGLRDKRVGAWVLGLGCLGAGLVAWFATDHVAEFLYRDQDADTVHGLNGRRELWEWVLANPIGSEVHGVGIGAVRGGLPQSWDPQNTHSAWIEILQTLGVLGLGVMGAVVVALSLMALLHRSVQATWMIAFVAVASVTSVTVSQPGAPLILLGLCIVVLAGHERRWALAEGDRARALPPDRART